MHVPRSPGTSGLTPRRSPLKEAPQTQRVVLVPVEAEQDAEDPDDHYDFTDHSFPFEKID